MSTNCEVCLENKSKYKCPKCGIRYCSLICFKSEKHVHEIVSNQLDTEATIPAPTTESKQETQPEDPVITKLLQSDKFRELLKEPSIQLNLGILQELLNNVSITNEYNTEGRVEIVSKKLANYRSGGLEENALFEEFCQLILDNSE
ncbi:hypothetical protein CANARDRAFT_193759 [[Candida] arabinofermentans NRRL YB-2248]|uniref:HIT-type domain-containing protein n=1 Tax=[Candida] arabinofermentans NRRL YB-2248 TaxID=983967 RepID=A0A1E4T885_9ASCO|nr:hypothetical protein CANARDRAFT_193759 [[Candida] arabinofermentans NRRL YB-2248]